MGKFRFRVRLRQFRATDLVGTPSSLDPFVKVNFDSFKKFNTSSVSGTANPRWDTDTQFVYETQYADKLHRKRVVLMVYSKNTIASDDLLGQVDVDLKTLACGPQQQDVQLWNESKPAGRLQFLCEMEEVGAVTLFVKDLLVTGLPLVGDEPPSTHVVVSTQSYAYDAKHAKAHTTKRETVEIRTDTKTATTDPEFLAFEQLRFTATLKELLAGPTAGIDVRVYSDSKTKKGLMGSVTLPFEKYHSFKDLAIIAFNEPLHVTGEFKSAGPVTVQGALYYKGFPTHAQMVGGVHTENGVADGRVFAKGCVLPPNHDPASAEPPAHEDDDDHSQLSREHHAVSVKSPGASSDDVAADGKSSGGSRSRGNSAADSKSSSAAGASAQEGHGHLLSVQPHHSRKRSAGSGGSAGMDLPALSSLAAAGSSIARSPSPSPGGSSGHNRARSPSPSPSPRGPSAAPSSAPVHHLPVRAASPAPASNPAVAHHQPSQQPQPLPVPAVAYAPMVSPVAGQAKGVAGWCFACGKTADYVDSQTKQPVCGRDCKLVWLAHVAVLQGLAAGAAVAGGGAAAAVVAAPGSEKKAVAPAAPVAATALPPGWEQKIDPGSGRVFYQNNITKTTQWHRPDPAAVPAAAPAIVAPVAVAPSSSSSSSSSSIAAAAGAAIIGKSSSPHPKPSPAAPTRAVSGGGSAPSGWNCTACTFLNADIAVACIQCRTAAPHLKAAPAKPAVDPHALPAGHWACTACTLANPPLALMCSACRTPKPLGPTPTPAPAPAVVAPAPSKPAGWSCPACTMINAAAAAKCDACGKANPSAAAAAAAAAKPASSSSSSSAAKKPSALTDPLPAGWEAAWDHAHGRVYYKNHATRKTQWTKPTEPAVAAGGAALTFQPKPPSGAAPPQQMQPQPPSALNMQPQHLPPDIQRLVAAGASVTVYQPNHPALHALLGQPGVQAQHVHGPPLNMQPAGAAGGGGAVHHAAPIAVYRTPDGRFVDAQGRPVQL